MSSTCSPVPGSPTRWPCAGCPERFQRQWASANVSSAPVACHSTECSATLRGQSCRWVGEQDDPRYGRTGDFVACPFDPAVTDPRSRAARRSCQSTRNSRHPPQYRSTRSTSPTGSRGGAGCSCDATTGLHGVTGYSPTTGRLGAVLRAHRPCHLTRAGSRHRRCERGIVARGSGHDRPR